MPRINEDNNTVTYVPLSPNTKSPTTPVSTVPVKTAAELDAIAAANKAANDKAIADLKALDNPPAKTVVDPLKDKSVKPEAPAGYVYIWVGSTKNGSWQLYRGGSSSSSSGKTGNGGSTVSTGSTGASDAAIKALQDQIAAMNKANQDAAAQAAATAAAAAAAEAAKTAAQREAVGKILSDTFTKYGLGSLANKVMDLARQGYTEATITLELQNTPEYQARFSANQDRIKKNLAVLTPAEYVASEDAYRQTLRAYGLTQFDNDTYVKQFIANDVSAAELSSRVSLAVQRVQNADPTVTQTLRDYYGIGQSDMVAYILDPNQTLPKIQQQVAAAEIGSAARLQGLEAGVSVSEQLARQGITQAEAQKGYATIADILPTAEKLSQIYGTEAPYDQSQAEQEVFNSLASAQRKRRALVARETGTFSGAAGTTRTSLTSSKQGSF
jgi:hypothetical protein